MPHARLRQIRLLSKRTFPATRELAEAAVLRPLGIVSSSKCRAGLARMDMLWRLLNELAKNSEPTI
jgi:hypothetical protein